MIEYYEEEEVYYEEVEEDMEEEIQEISTHDLPQDQQQPRNHVETIQEVDSEHEAHSMDTSSNKKGTQFRTTLNTLGSLSPPNETNPFQGASGVQTGKQRTLNSSIERRSTGGINSEAKKSAKGKMTLTRDHSRSLGDEPISLAGSRTGNNSRVDGQETLVFMPSRSVAQASEEMVTLEAKSRGGEMRQGDFISLSHLSPSGKSSATKQKHKVYRVRQRSRISNLDRMVHTQNPSFDSTANNLFKDKLAIIAEKVGLRMVLKEITARVGQINELFSRKNIQHEMIMSN